jgi:(1->4)-alpha-D-glucan 1-alpha-D-glucosylmutase
MTFVATYRLQLTPAFGFDAARALVPYLRELGVSHLYLSPIMRAREGSTHGYDVVDPAAVSPALGGEEAFRALADAAHEAGLGVIVDFVPNHMAASDENRYWSEPALRERFFDVDSASGWHRRFFTIDDLAGVRVEDPEVFEATHAKILQLTADGLVDGLRIDHIDGLADPAGYLERLRARGVELIWVEKILEADERLRDWPVQGTTGYEFAVGVTSLLVDSDAEAPLTALYAELTGEQRQFGEVAAEAKLEQARTAFAPEVRKLRSLYDDPAMDLAVASLHVYRSYVEPAGGVVAAEDREVLAAVPQGVRQAMLLEEPAPAEFVIRFQQTTGAVMAKGVEDTAFYRYLRLVALNEVGGDPGRFSLPAATFHSDNESRSRSFPRCLLASQTHDTKRSGDVRARIAALAGRAEEWSRLVREWREVNAPLRDPAGGPDGAEEYLVYQTLIGAWPIEPDRITAYLEKALREGKRNTNWDQPDEGWERSVMRFTTALYDHEPFRRTFDPFADAIAAAGERLSLAALLLQLTSPGVPDIYQGDELWSLNLVDPDNRRPVDFELRRAALARLAEEEPRREELKLYVIREALALRRRRPEAFVGAYTPLDAPEGLCAFTRGEPATVAVVVAVREHAEPSEAQPPEGEWRDLLPVAPVRLLERA